MFESRPPSGASQCLFFSLSALINVCSYCFVLLEVMSVYLWVSNWMCLLNVGLSVVRQCAVLHFEVEDDANFSRTSSLTSM